MPTYAYQCPAGHEFERFERKISDRSRLKCPECGKMATRLISGGAGLLFKGSGFYITDYRGSGEKKGEKGEKGEEKGTGKPEAKGESTGEAKGDSKRDAKSDSSSKRKSSGDDS